MALETAVPIAVEVLKCLAVPINNQLRLVMCSRSYTQDLQEEVKNLKYHFSRVQKATEKAIDNLGIVYDEVMEWQVSAEKAMIEAQELVRNFEEENKTCCYRTLPAPNRLHHFSREANNKKKEIQQLVRIGRDITDIYFFGHVTEMNHSNEGVFESRALILLQIIDALADDSKSVVGIYGMGGVGKSTLLLDAKSIIEPRNMFYRVAKADLMGKLDIRGIQEEIASSLQLEMMNKEDVKVRADSLRNRLVNEEKMKRKVLIILDNLSEKLDLRSVGIPCGHDNKVRGCKLLLTSRDRNVLMKDMHCDSDSVFRLRELPEEEAKILFEKTAGERARRDEFKPLVDTALHKCAGLPRLIVEMANIFRNASLSRINDALHQIEMSQNEGIGKIINDMMQSSYDHLQGKAFKAFLRLCVVYADAKPKRENLLRYGMGYVLGSEYKTMKSARNRLNTLIETIEASSLSLDNEDAGIFKLHEMFDKFVTMIASRDDHLLMLKDQDELPKNKLKDCRAICFTHNDVMKLPEELDCPELLIFLLFTHNKSLEVPDSYFNSARNLVVLNLTGICLTRSTLPSPFRFLDNLHTLCLDDCSLENVSVLGDLKGLQILSFVNSKIQQLPKEIGQLTELRLLDLNNCPQLQTIELDVLGSLTKLEELYMNSFHQWNVVDLETRRSNASLTELNNMTKLYTLHICITEPSVLPKDLNFNKLNEYKIQIGRVLHLPRYEVSKTLMIQLTSGSTVIWDVCVETTLPSTEYLYLDGLNGDVPSICSLRTEEFPNLKHLHVENSPFVIYILIWSYRTSFKMLKSLILQSLDNLEKICQRCTTFESFKSLEEVRIESCDKIKVLFPFPLARELSQLKQIRVISCKSIQNIVEVKDCGKVELCDLRVLELRNLPNIKNFFTAGTAPSSSTSVDHVRTQVAFFYMQQVLIPSLESLTMVGLSNLKYIWSDESPLGQSNLQFLEVACCKSLLKIINFRSLVKLQKLQTLIVAHCVLMQEIFDIDGSSASENVELPSKLTTLCLEKLPNLRHIWNKNPCGVVKFHCLKRLKVSGCNNLRFIFFPSMVKSLVQLRELTVQNCETMEAIIMEEEMFEMETSEILSFPMLTNLCFEHLEILTCFFHRKCSREARSQNHIKSQSTALFNGKVAFARLQTLIITGMNNIEMIWDSQVIADSFPTLKTLCVDKCSELANIGPSCILRWLSNLETLEAKACSSLEVVFKLQPPYSLDRNDVAGFRLRQLQLIELPELKCVWNEELFHQVNFHYLLSISISKCKSLTSLFSASIATDLMLLEESEIEEYGNVKIIENTTHTSHWPPLKTLEVHDYNNVEILASQPENEMSLHKQPPVLIKKGINVEAEEGPSRKPKISAVSIYFQCLKTLIVSNCDALLKMFTLAIAENLVSLTELRISCCKMLTEIISDEGGKEGCVVTFRQLKYIKLDGLTKLRCFSLGSCTLIFPLLEDIIVTECLNMELFSGGKMEAPKVDRVQISRGTYWKENLNITIQNIYKEMAMVTSIKFIQLSEFPELIRKWHGKIDPVGSSWQLESLVVDKCSSFTNAIPSTLMHALDNMRTLQVCDCESLEEILDLEGLKIVGSTLVLPKLQHLVLVNLPKLRQLWNKDLQGTLFLTSLRDLTLYDCSNLRHAFAPMMAQCLANLAKMDIRECAQMEGVIAEEQLQGSIVEKITFPRLSSMKLEHLSKLTSFLSGKNHRLDCPKLEHLTIAHCPKMQSLTWQSLMEINHGTASLFTSQVQLHQLESMVISHMDSLIKIWTDCPQETFTFKNLRKMEAQNCMSLEIMFPYRVATSLNQLEELRIESCGLKEIVTRGDDTPFSSTTQVLFPKLTSLVLHDMPRLKNFSPNLPTLNYPSLKELRVTHCDKLNMLCFTTSMNRWAQRDSRDDLQVL